MQYVYFWDFLGITHVPLIMNDIFIANWNSCIRLTSLVLSIGNFQHKAILKLGVNRKFI